MNNSKKQKVEKWLKSKKEKETKKEFLQKMMQQVEEFQSNPEFIKKLELYSALGNEIRFTIMKLLEQEPLCTCVLSKILDLKESTISYHLKILEQAGLLFGLKSGAFINYHTKKSVLKELE
jgi:DNA-binding transcriptional ArsR family regulator